jgi:hypothetical protein
VAGRGGIEKRNYEGQANLPAERHATVYPAISRFVAPNSDQGAAPDLRHLRGGFRNGVNG